MKKVIHSGRGKPAICRLIQGETYTMSDVRIGSTFFKSSTLRSVGTVKDPWSKNL